MKAGDSMNYYVDIINKAIDYIEDNIGAPLSLEEVAGRFCISEFHFNRMFRTVAGRTLKQYILGRKLARAYERLIGTKEPVIDIAYDFGFEYPEVFSRAFKKQFGVSPNGCRSGGHGAELVAKAVVVERDIANYQGSLALKGRLECLQELQLEGIYTEVDTGADDFEAKLRETGAAFMDKASKADWLNRERLYATVSCHGEDNGEYTVFYGLERKRDNSSTPYSRRTVPAGWYAGFSYRGDMLDIRETFVDDLYRWIMVREIQLEPNGIGMLDIFEEDYYETGNVKIYVPVKGSQKQQEMS